MSSVCFVVMTKIFSKLTFNQCNAKIVVSDEFLTSKMFPLTSIKYYTVVKILGSKVKSYS